MDRRNAERGSARQANGDQHGWSGTSSVSVGQESSDGNRGATPQSRRLRWTERASPTDDADGWWLVLNPAGRIVAVEGGAPARWVGAQAGGCEGMDEALRRALIAAARQPL